MGKAAAVIGASYGDEGKGLLVDALVAPFGANAIVARFNGGAQAGHTVMLPNGVRHVFHHWGAGALAGASTYLGPRFVVHPMFWARETQDLAMRGACLGLYVDPRSRITLPCDVMVNQAIEAKRNDGRHGSCGMGFGETCERNLHEGYGLTVGQAASMDDQQLMDHLDQVNRQYVPRRLAALGMDEDILGSWLHADAIKARFIEDLRCFLANATVSGPSILGQFEQVVFEGAQGLALDEELGHFPHVTRSMTGTPYLVELACEARIKELDVWYATRAYTTRHGAGPLPHECGQQLVPRFRDDTNLPNPHQGSLRFAPLDPMAIADRIERDLARAPSGCELSPGVFVSCLDQVDEVLLPDGGAWTCQEAPDRLGSIVGAKKAAFSRGPMRTHVQLPGVEPTIAPWVSRQRQFA